MRGRTQARAAKLSDPHNSFFAYVFGGKEEAIGLLRASLPLEFSERMDWESLARRPADFVDAELRWRHSDLLFSVRPLDTVEEVLVYILVEHQASPHVLMAYRVLRYLVRIWDDYLKARPGCQRLPLIVPLVIYHGRERWSVARTLRELFDAPTAAVDAAAADVPQSGYRLLDLRGREGVRLIDRMFTAFGRVALWAMSRTGADEDLPAELRGLRAALNGMMEQPNAEAAFGALLRYILAVHERIDRSDLQRVVADVLDPQAGEKMVSVYEQLIEEGRQKGLAEGKAKGEAKGEARGVAKGIAKGRAELLLDLLVAKFGSVPPTVRARVKNATAEELTAWGVRVLTAKTLAEVFDAQAKPRTTRAPRRARR